MSSWGFLAMPGRFRRLSAGATLAVLRATLNQLQAPRPSAGAFTCVCCTFQVESRNLYTPPLLPTGPGILSTPTRARFGLKRHLYRAPDTRHVGLRQLLGSGRSLQRDPAGLGWLCCVGDGRAACCHIKLHLQIQLLHRMTRGRFAFTGCPKPHSCAAQDASQAWGLSQPIVSVSLFVCACV